MVTTIHLPDGTDASTVKTEQIMTANKIVSRSTYSNGLIIEMEQDADTVNFHCNRELKTLPNGEVQIL